MDGAHTEHLANVLRQGHQLFFKSGVVIVVVCHPSPLPLQCMVSLLSLVAPGETEAFGGTLDQMNEASLGGEPGCSDIFATF
jgi:hypothetical protein